MLRHRPSDFSTNTNGNILDLPIAFVSIDLAGNVNIFNVIKRIILKIFLCVVPTCQPDTANMSPTWQLLVFFFMSYVVSCVIDC
jgi:hypothetical protein